VAIESQGGEIVITCDECGDLLASGFLTELDAEVKARAEGFTTEAGDVICNKCSGLED